MIITLFFRHSALIDNHNQARQFLLALEKAWVVQCGFFWLSTTVLGMEVTNAWKAAKLLKPIKYGDMDVKEFDAVISWQIIIDRLIDVLN